jgi:hypothetical protein
VPLDALAPGLDALSAGFAIAAAEVAFAAEAAADAANGAGDDDDDDGDGGGGGGGHGGGAPDGGAAGAPLSAEAALKVLAEECAAFSDASAATSKVRAAVEKGGDRVCAWVTRLGHSLGSLA